MSEVIKWKYGKKKENEGKKGEKEEIIDIWQWFNINVDVISTLINLIVRLFCAISFFVNRLVPLMIYIVYAFRMRQ